jgi:hypothetical protein
MSRHDPIELFIKKWLDHIYSIRDSGAYHDEFIKGVKRVITDLDIYLLGLQMREKQ